ncbi:MAG TPA: PDZ domain-containing protein [Candidatus Marinimicrobia bacterium]|nr:PDZ domain-containing protein [Candidatus Neomarinimicrobiota bacterium]
MITPTIKKILHYLMIPLITMSLLKPAIAEDADEKSHDLGREYRLAAKELKNWFKKSGHQPEIPDGDRPSLGYYVDNISFKDAYELNFSGNRGVLVSGNRSWNDNPVLQREDIISKIDGVPLKHRSHFDDIIRAKPIGDSVTVEYIRYGVTFQRKLPVINANSAWKIEHPLNDRYAHKSRGFGGAGYKPMYVNMNLTPINDLFGSLGFNELSEINNLHHGFDLQGLVGNGWFIGGYGVWTGQQKSINYTVDPATPVYRNLQYKSGMGGAALDKRFRLGDRWMLSTGLMIGGGSTKFEIDQFEKTVEWQELGLDTTGSYNDYLQLQKKYTLLQPRIALMYRIMPILWIKLEVGYMLAYSKNGWQQILNDNKHDLGGPVNDSSMSGFTVSISPFFGF